MFYTHVYLAQNTYYVIYILLKRKYYIFSDLIIQALFSLLYRRKHQLLESSHAFKEGNHNVNCTVVDWPFKVSKRSSNFENGKAYKSSW